MGIEIYKNLSKPPAWALKKIENVRGLSGKTDISPQWRIQALTEQFGLCGIGWKFEITRQWSENFLTDIRCFTNINLFVKIDEKWSDAIPGTGGSKLLSEEKNGMYISDEGYKMALTDAISVAAKMIGVGAEIYNGSYDGSKYIRDVFQEQAKPQKLQKKPAQQHNALHDQNLTQKNESKSNRNLLLIQELFDTQILNQSAKTLFENKTKTANSDVVLDAIYDSLLKKKGE